jgi:PAS domain S-box-containing protein
MTRAPTTTPNPIATASHRRNVAAPREQYEHILDSILEGCQLIDPDFRYAYVNDMAAKQGHSSKQALTGHTMMEKYPGIEKTVMFKKLRVCMEKRTPDHIGNEFTFPDGSRGWFELTMQPFAEGVLILSLSTADNRQPQSKEEIANKERSALASIVEFSEDAIIGKTLDGVVTSWNRGAEKMYGYSVQEMVGSSINKIVPRDHPDELPEILKRVRQGQTINHFETVRIKKDGSPIEVSLSISPIKSISGKIIGASTIARDVTERKQLQAAEAKAQLVTALEAANKDLEAFSYSVSHDLRAPLRAIDGFSKILSEDYAGKLDDEGQHVIATIRHSVEQMGQLIDDLLTFSRLGRKPVKLEDVQMTALARTVFDELKLIDPKRTINFSCDELPNARGDSALLHEVWANLLSNAVKYTKKKTAATIAVGTRSTGTDDVYYVKDNGAGFDMKYVDKLFGVFQRLHDAQDFEGTGVGLAIVARIIKKHGGKVWAEGQVDQGATFYFSLPRGSQEVQPV